MFVSRPATRNTVVNNVDSLTDLLEETFKTDSLSDITSYDNSTDSLNVSQKSPYLPSAKNKMRSGSDSGTESLISEKFGLSSAGMSSYRN